ncbi:MAG: hypothetical protein KY464_16250 [Gemmatimonadetes bacterium]|nr:hypothetical protein [Gemmatimonadota bacterium]
MEKHEKSPQTAAEQDAPQQERMVTPEEEAGMDLQKLKQPPQAEGQREVEDDQIGNRE